MKNYKIVSPYSYNFGPNHMESNSQELVTVPGQSMTPKELLRRFGAGMPLEGQEPIFENDDLDDIENPMRNPDFDISDVAPYIMAVKEKSASKKAEVKERGSGKTPRKADITASITDDPAPEEGTTEEADQPGEA